MIVGGLLAFAIGACIGSFLNVASMRTRAGETLGGRSRCPSCQRQLRVVELIPVLSFLLLRGKCRGCELPISPQYPLVEFATGALFSLWFLQLGSPVIDASALPTLLIGAAFLSVLVLIFLHDLRYFLIPDVFTVPAMAVAFVLNLWAETYTAGDMLLGAAVLGGFFLVQFAVSKGKWIGGGDIRMGVLMGFMLGLRDGLGALFIAYVLGALVGLYLLLTKKATRKTQLPFGTFLAVGTAIMLLYGRPLVGWYIGFFA